MHGRCKAESQQTATALATSQAHHFLPEIYKQATAQLGPAPASKTPSPKNFEDDPLPRRQVVRRMKETITKSAILVGVGKSIEAAFCLNSVTEVSLLRGVEFV